MVRVDLKPDGVPTLGRCYEFTRHPMAAGGRWIAFTSSAIDLIHGDTNSADDVFVRDLEMGVTVRVSISSAGVEGNNQSSAPSISGDGRFVAFQSYASNLVPGDKNNVADIFVRDRDPDEDGIFDETDAVTVVVSVKATGQPSDGHSVDPSIAADGSYVAFQSFSDLDGVNRSGSCVFGYDPASGTIECLSAAPDGGDPGGGDARYASVSADGLRIAFDCQAPFIVPNDTNSDRDIFVRDRATGITTLVSVDSNGVQGDDDSFEPVISGDGNCVAFATEAENLSLVTRIRIPTSSFATPSPARPS